MKRIETPEERSVSLLLGKFQQNSKEKTPQVSRNTYRKRKKQNRKEKKKEREKNRDIESRQTKNFACNELY